MKTFVVAVYLTDLSFGGPEEGGWYYDTGNLVRIMRAFKNEQSALAYTRRLNRKLEVTLNRGRKPISSVHSTGVYEAQIHDDYAPKHFPEKRPYYE